jgi:pilus assembly protein CpaB
MGRRTLLLIASILVAAAGTALVWLYAQGAESRAQAGNVQVPVLMATQPIDAGSGRAQITDQMVERKLMSARDAPADRLASLNDIGAYRASQTILTGQPLIKAQFASAAAVSGVQDKRAGVAVSMEDPNRVAGLLRPESHVAIYLIETDGPRAKAGGGQAVSMLLPDVRVIAIGGTTTAVMANGLPAKVGTQTGVPTAVVTLDVAGPEATKVMLGQAVGTLYFTLLGTNSKGAPTDDLTTSNLVGR